jgi:hypothetical protein
VYGCMICIKIMLIKIKFVHTRIMHMSSITFLCTDLLSYVIVCIKFEVLKRNRPVKIMQLVIILI